MHPDPHQNVMDPQQWLGDKKSRRTRPRGTKKDDVSLPEEGNRHDESKDVASRLQYQLRPYNYSTFL
jgi:hypothetical protein